ncbi:T9SS type A sorting domain-containing protein [Flavobacterium sp. D11R37]|uniref:T9SS type A sorting domain-containing protein n=1 Tax=Flavobacterium coralii TaxID=2838017 RepID=UPI001CA75082|nr:T9SS type A sorting domain-containing protein [Flavobacterium coralii]MBY8962129.1 T9SS type A sorting domain-containing protein [Flavobacterium coralii]
MRKTLLFSALLAATFNYAQTGALDPTFGNGGKVITPINSDERANALIIQPDGKIVIAGYTYSAVYGNDVACLRYNTDGTLDTTFGTNGIATFDMQLGSDDKAMAIDIQSDGKLVLGGYSDSGSNKDAFVMRLNTNGTIDSAFGTDGKVFTNYSTNGQSTRQDEYWVVKIHALTGKIVAGGTSYSASNSSRAILARYTPDGMLDTSFANDGKYTSLPNSQTIQNYLFFVEDLAIKPNGKITVAGWSSDWFYLGRLNENGTMDTSFSSDGYNHLWGGSMYSVVLNNDDSFYFTGDIWTSPQTEVYTGYINADGSGLQTNHFNFGSTTTATTFALAKDATGKLIVAGYLRNDTNGHISFLVGRLLSNLDADTSFGNGGFITTNFNEPVSAALDMKLQADGKIVLAGLSGSNIALARYNPSLPLSSEIVTEKERISLYPNPANDKINIALANTGITKYTIADTNGRTITTGQLTEDINSIDIQNLENGVYFIKLNNADSDTNLKFIKE